MSYNLVDPTTGDLTRVAGGIDTSIIPSDASANNKLATTDWVSVSNYIRHTNKDLNSAGWYKIAKLTPSNYGSSIIVKLTSNFNYYNNVALTFCLSYAYLTADCRVLSYTGNNDVFTSIRLINDYVEVYYAQNVPNAVNAIIMISENNSGQTQIENFVADSTATGGIEWNPNNVLVVTQSDLNSKGVFKGHIAPNKKLTISMDPYSEVYGYVQVQGSASTPFRLHNTALNATPTVFLKRSVTINEENVYVDKPFGTTVSIGSVTIANTNGVWTITNTTTETESYWVGGGVDNVTLSDA